MDEKHRRDDLERVLEETLDEGGTAKLSEEELAERARERISAPYEYRVQAERDPILEETQRFRRLAKEVDDRYDKYAGPQDAERD
ncbi:hypothetical protein MO973_24220 [Paenibacillus sp. TRM 82003]|nr:hypothetical protein [Paenibacillus sp. TRM 82003]